MQSHSNVIKNKNRKYYVYTEKKLEETTWRYYSGYLYVPGLWINFKANFLNYKSIHVHLRKFGKWRKAWKEKMNIICNHNTHPQIIFYIWEIFCSYFSISKYEYIVTSEVYSTYYIGTYFPLPLSIFYAIKYSKAWFLSAVCLSLYECILM